MAKSIKFNLTVDNKPIRTIEELRENFCINDIDELYREGRLQKWLEVRGFDEYLAQIKEINHETPIYKLIDIFGMGSKISKDEVNKIVSNIYYENERKKQLAVWEKKNNDVKSIIQVYHAKYDELKNVMIENPSNFPLIKSTINEICKNYFGLFKLNYVDFYYEIYDKIPLIVYACLMNEQSSRLFLGYYPYNLPKKLPLPFVDNILKKYTPILENVIKNYSGKFDIVNNCKNKDDIEKYILKLSGSTDGYWDEKEPLKQKVMILGMSSSAEVNSADKKDSGLKRNYVKGFVILDGLQYRAQRNDDFVYYMLVD